MAYLITCGGSKKNPTNASQGKLEDLFRNYLLGCTLPIFSTVRI
jgi:hypothetical protein